MPVGCMQIFFGKGILCFPKSNQLTMEEDDLVKIRCNLAEVVMDNQDGLTFLFQGVECLHDDVFANGVNTSEGLIQKYDICLLDQTAGDQDPLELPTRKLTNLAIC